MATIRSFRDLIAYQKARAAAKRIFNASKRFPKEEKYSLTDQIRRSSRAVGGMIAEAWARRRYIAVWENKIDEAMGETTETQAWLDSALDSEYLTLPQHESLDKDFQELGAILRTLIEKSESFCEPPAARRR